jgi:hypothetical protein
MQFNHKSYCFYELVNVTHFVKRFSKIEEFVKSRSPVFVIPAKAGIQGNHPAVGLDSRLRGSDGLGDLLRDHQD